MRQIVHPLSGWQRTRSAAVALCVGFGSATACTFEDPRPQAEIDFETARAELPRLLDLQRDVITPNCAPNPGVCHQSEEYPELHTVTAVLETIGSSCNAAPPNPLLGWDACERAPDWVSLGEFGSAIAQKERVGPNDWVLTLANPLPPNLVPAEPSEEVFTSAFALLDDSGATLLAPPEEWRAQVWSIEGSRSISLRVLGPPGEDVAEIVNSVLTAAVPGDPNANGVWGGLALEDHARMLSPGDKELSYLWRRMLGDVPGDPMPLANGPITNVHMLALGCWIEGLDPTQSGWDPNALIDYDGCGFSIDPPLLIEPSEFDSDSEQ